MRFSSRQRLYLLFLFWIGINWGYTQPNSDITISIDTTQSKNVGKSLGLALGLSSLVPGAGEWYLKDSKSAKSLILIDVGFWAGVWMSLVAMDTYLSSAQSYASQYGGLEGDGKSIDFLTTMSNFRSYQEKQNRRDSYEFNQTLSGKPSSEWDIAPTPENYWDFGTPLDPQNTQNWRAFRESVKMYGRAKVVRNWMVGGLIIGRMVSFFNTLNLYRSTSVEGLSYRDTPRELTHQFTWVSLPTPSGWMWNVDVSF